MHDARVVPRHAELVGLRRVVLAGDVVAEQQIGERLEAVRERPRDPDRNGVVGADVLGEGLPRLAVERSIDGEVVESDVEGRVVLSAGARLERCRVRGPVAIGEGAVVRDAYIGPYTAIGPNCHVDHCEIENSILLEGSIVADLDTRLEGSLIGRNVRVRRSQSKPKAYRLLVGDNSEIKIP